MRESSTYETIKKSVDRIRIVDTHEHFPPERERLMSNADPLATLFQHYASSDLVSAGLSEEELDEIIDSRISLDQRWKKFSPYWDKIQNTGYARALNIAVRDLYDVDGISEETYRELAKRMGNANKEGLYRRVLRDKAGIDISIVDIETVDVDTDLFAPVMRFQEYVLAKERSEIANLAEASGMSIHTLSDFTRSLELQFQKLAQKMIGIKIPLAYRRPIHFEKRSFEEAEKVFNRILRMRFFKRVDRSTDRQVTQPEALSFEEAIPLQDYMVHKIIQLTIKYDLPIQIHTGIQEGNMNIVTNSNPVHLVNLFIDYQKAKFDILHGSYPYTAELATLAKNFQNVYVDLCWLHVISPSHARRALSEFLDTVPSNKILAFGGDYRFVEGAYAHAVIARQNIARVLAEKVDEDGYGGREAISLAKKLLRDNAKELFLHKTVREPR